MAKRSRSEMDSLIPIPAKNPRDSAMGLKQPKNSAMAPENPEPELRMDNEAGKTAFSSYQNMLNIFNRLSLVKLPLQLAPQFSTQFSKDKANEDKARIQKANEMALKRQQQFTSENEAISAEQHLNALEQNIPLTPQLKSQLLLMPQTLLAVVKRAEDYETFFNSLPQEQQMTLKEELVPSIVNAYSQEQQNSLAPENLPDNQRHEQLEKLTEIPNPLNSVDSWAALYGLAMWSGNKAVFPVLGYMSGQLMSDAGEQAVQGFDHDRDERHETGLESALNVISGGIVMAETEKSELREELTNDKIDINEELTEQKQEAKEEQVESSFKSPFSTNPFDTTPDPYK